MTTLKKDQCKTDDHQWQKTPTEEGRVYGRCVRCGKVQIVDYVPASTISDVEAKIVDFTRKKDD